MQTLYNSLASQLLFSLFLLIPWPDTDASSNELCANPESIYCCKEKREQVPDHEGIYIMSRCRYGITLMNGKRIDDQFNLEYYRERRLNKIVPSDMTPSETAIRFSFKSEELEYPGSPEVWRGKAKLTTHRVCCQPPSTMTPSIRACKPCKCSISLQKTRMR